jgi:hypothetical protein
LWKFTPRVLIPVLLIIFAASAAQGREYTVRRRIDNYTVDVVINRNPPILGKNEIRIAIKDPSGKYVMNAGVSVNYYMPPMPGMPPMNYTLKAAPEGSGYGAVMDLIMTGPWNIAIRIVTEGKVLRLTIPIDAR